MIARFVPLLFGGNRVVFFFCVCSASVDAVPDAISFRKALFMTAFRLHPCPSLFWLPTAHIFDLGTRAHTH